MSLAKQAKCCFCCNGKKGSNLKSSSSITSQYGKDELLDLSATQRKIKLFVPISKEITFPTTCAYINATTIIHPFSSFRLAWDCLIMLILIFTLFEIPLTLSFSIETSNLHEPYGIFVLMMDVFLCLDIVFNFRTAFYDQFDALALIVDPNVIAKKYAKSWFVIDFITSFPFEFMVPVTTDIGGAGTILRAFRVVRFIRLLKLIRFFRMLKLVNTFLREIMGPRSQLMVRLLKLIAYMILAAHFAACAWYYVGIQNYKNKQKGSWLITQNVDISNKAESYLVSMYWSVVTLFTTGYGDIVPVNSDERIVAMTVVLLGSCFFAYLIGAVGSLVAEGDRARIIREEKFEQAQAFCAHKTLPPQLSRAIMTHTSYFWKRNFVYDDIEILSSLPYGIQCDVLKYHGNRIFSDFQPFDMLPETTKGLLALKLKQFSCNKGIAVYRHEDIAKEFYIQRTGKSVLIIPQKKRKSHHRRLRTKSINSVSFMSQSSIKSDAEMEEINIKLSNVDDEDGKFKKNKFKLQTIKGKRVNLGPGDVLGHIGFCKGQREGTLYCQTWSEFYALSKRDLEEVLMWEHPEKCGQILKEIKKRMKAFKYKSSKRKRRRSKRRLLNGMNEDEEENEGEHITKRRGLTVRLNETEKKPSKNFLSLFEKTDSDKKIVKDDNMNPIKAMSPRGILKHFGKKDENNQTNDDQKQCSIELTQQNKGSESTTSTEDESSSSTDSDSETAENLHENNLNMHMFKSPSPISPNKPKVRKIRKKSMGKKNSSLRNREIAGSTRRPPDMKMNMEMSPNKINLHSVNASDDHDDGDNTSDQSIQSDSPLIHKKARYSHTAEDKSRRKMNLKSEDVIIVLEHEEDDREFTALPLQTPDVAITPNVETPRLHLNGDSGHRLPRYGYDSVLSKSPDVHKHQQQPPLALVMQQPSYESTIKYDDNINNNLPSRPSSRRSRNGISRSFGSLLVPSKNDDHHEDGLEIKFKQLSVNDDDDETDQGFQAGVTVVDDESVYNKQNKEIGND